MAKDYLVVDDTLLFESDIILEDAVLDDLISDSRDTLALVDKYEPWMDGTCVKLNESDEIVEFVPGKKFDFTDTSDYFKTVNLYKFSKEFSQTRYVPFLEAYQSALGKNEYYEQVLKVIATLDEPVIKAKRLAGERWYEIDDVQDLDIAESLFAESEEDRLKLIQKRYGGYWRYPKLLDFCYLVNPYYPPLKMKEELKASFDVLLTQYPSGMAVNSLLAAKNFNVHSENILVGNGAAELIKSYMNTVTGKVGFVRPTFEEYPNRYDAEQSVSYVPDNNDFSYTADDLIAFFNEHPVETLVVVNPDNPSGNYVPKVGVLKLADWCSEKGIKLLMDESFVDFSDEENATLLNQRILDSYPNLSVMKSISKSYGVPGLRLGILASGDKALISYMKRDVAIWNINSFGEYYLQIAGKYEKDYVNALKLFRTERERFCKELSCIKCLRVIPSQANYLMVELDNRIQATELTKKLLIKDNILIKELAAKTNGRNYLRLAVRNTEDNDILLDALRQELDSE